MRWRKSDGTGIRKTGMNRVGSLPYSPYFHRINYIGLDGSLDGVCPCDYPLEAYFYDATNGKVEKRTGTYGGSTVDWTSAGTFPTGLIPYIAYNWCVDANQYIYILFRDTTTRLACIDGSDGSTVFTKSQSDFETAFGIGPTVIVPDLLGVRAADGVYLRLNSDGIKLFSDGTFSATGALAAAAGSLRSTLTRANGMSFNHPTGFMVRGTTTRLYDDSFAVSASVSPATAPSYLFADASGNVYSVDSANDTHKYDSSLTEITSGAWPMTDHVVVGLWNASAGASPESLSPQPFVLIHDTNSPNSGDGLYDADGTKLWNWGSHSLPDGGMPGLYTPRDAFIGVYPEASNTDFVMYYTSGGAGGVPNLGIRYNQYGTEISRSNVSSSNGYRQIAPIGLESCFY